MVILWLGSAEWDSDYISLRKVIPTILWSSRTFWHLNGVFITKGLDAAKNVCGRNNKNEEKVLGLRRTYITPPIIMIIIWIFLCSWRHTDIRNGTTAHRNYRICCVARTIHRNLIEVSIFKYKTISLNGMQQTIYWSPPFLPASSSSSSVLGVTPIANSGYFQIPGPLPFRATPRFRIIFRFPFPIERIDPTNFLSMQIRTIGGASESFQRRRRRRKRRRKRRRRK